MSVKSLCHSLPPVDFSPSSAAFFTKRIFESKRELSLWISLVSHIPIAVLERKLAACGAKKEELFKQWSSTFRCQVVVERVLQIASTKNAPNPHVRSRIPARIDLNLTGEKIQGHDFVYDPLLGGKMDITLPTGGCCSGMSHWFIMQYLKTQHLFSCPRTHVQWVAASFKEGANTEATLLQTFFLNKGKVLGLCIGIQEIYGDDPVPKMRVELPLQEISALICHNFINDIKGLPLGAYLVSGETEERGHECVYIKKEKVGYFFDPNTGVFEINGESQSEFLCGCIIKAMDCLANAPDLFEKELRKKLEVMKLLRRADSQSFNQDFYRNFLLEGYENFNKALSSYLKVHNEKRKRHQELVSLWEGFKDYSSEEILSVLIKANESSKDKTRKKPWLIGVACSLVKTLTSSSYCLEFIPVTLRKNPEGT